MKALIAGPGVFIYDGCIDRVHNVLAVTGSTPIAVIRQVTKEARIERCSFCGKRRHQVPAMASAGRPRICEECLQLCLEMRRERLT